MKAILVEKQQGRPTLVWGTAPDPRPGQGQVVIAVRAAGVNRADLAQAAGTYPPPPGASPLLGLEVAGEIAEVGPGVPATWRRGDRVCALLPGGGYAELATADYRHLLRLPQSWTFVQAASVPEAWITAWLNLINEGRLRAGETVLVHAGASGVGIAAIQIARRAGARVYATAGSQAKVRTCRELGATAVFDRSQEDFGASIAYATGTGVDVILDPVGGPYLARNLAALRERGRLVLIGLMGGGKGELDLASILSRSLEVRGSRLRPRTATQKAHIIAAFARDVWPALLSGYLRLLVDRTFAIGQAQDAHEYVRANRNTGKVVLEVPAP
jgi:NADPH:quinone reductase